MVKHIILWTIKEEYHDDRLEAVKAGIKEGLEGLQGQIPGMIDIRVYTDRLASSTAEVMLDSTFESPEALKGYSVNPAHVHIADTKVRPFTATRSSFDFEL